jgi:outer membrane receptor for Fe3+-dicitrate
VRTNVILVVGALAALRGGNAHAQDTARVSRDTVQRLPSVQVSATSLLSIAGPAVGSFPGRAETIPLSMMRVTSGEGVPALLASRAGISTYDDLGARSKVTLSLRGFSAGPVVGASQGLSVFIDGVPVNEPDAGQVNFDLLPIEDASRVEILRGTASLLGPNSLGGAVNIVTERGEPNAPSEVEAELGSFGRRQLRLSTGGERSGNRFHGGLTAGDEGGWRQHTNARRILGFGSGERTLGATVVRGQLIVGQVRAQTAGALPLSVYESRPDSNLTSGDFEELSQLHLALSGERHLSRGVAAATLYGRSNDADRFNVNQVNDPDVRSRSRNATVGAGGTWSSGILLGNAAVGFRAGGGGSLSRSGVRIFAERVDPGMTTDVESRSEKGHIYGSADYIIGPFTASAGARYDIIRIPFANHLSGQDTTSTFSRLSPRAGVSAASHGVSAYASIGQSFRAPAVIELACADPQQPCPLPFALGDDPPIDPVVATTREIGLSWTGDRLEVSASAYASDVANDIYLFPYDDAAAPSGSAIDGYFANIASTRRAGAEFSGELRAGRANFHANLALLRATFETDDIAIFSAREEAGGSNAVERGDRLPLLPDRTFAGGATIVLAKGVVIGVSTRYVGRRFLRGDEANDERPMDGFWMSDGSIELARGDWSIRAGETNMFDRGAQAFGTFNINQSSGSLERFVVPGEPRAIGLSVTRRMR